MDPTNGYNAALLTEVIIDVFERSTYREAVALTKVKDKTGCEAISICTADIGRIMERYVYIYGRFVIDDCPPIHGTSSSIVFLATDYSAK